MFRLKNGILHEDDKPTFLVGTSYFASYNPYKYPVAPDGDRFGEAVKDIAEIADFGFNNVRVAAFEKVEPNGNEYKIEMPFIDHMVNEIAKNNMSSVVRLQGYTMNLKSKDNAIIKNVNGEEVNKNDVSVFIYDNCFNKELVEDIKDATKALAKHFGKMKNVVGFQVYNEPYLSGKTFAPFDYSDFAINAYREYLIKKGVDEKKAKDFDPPRVFNDETKEDWIDYRLFITENFMNFLGDLNDAGDSVCEGMESETNFTACPTWHSCAHFSVNYFKAAKRMDYMGLDIYDPLKGGYFHYIKALMAMVESSAYVEGKNAQILEFCCRTHMTYQDFERQISTAVATGYKGVNFYAFRSDISGPEGGLGGLIYHDRRRTPKYDEAKKAIAVVKQLGNKIATSSKMREGVAIFESEYARHLSDLTEKSMLTSINRDVYDDIYKLGYSPDYVDDEHLLNNNLDIKMLFIANYSLLSESEKNIISEFAKKHYVFYYEIGVGYVLHNDCQGEITNEKMFGNYCWKLGEKGQIANWRFTIDEVFELFGNEPMVKCSTKSVDVGTLIADDDSFVILALTNIHSVKNNISDFDITLDKKLGEFKNAVLYTKDYEKEIELVCDEKTVVKIGEIETSGYVILNKK